MKAICNKSGLPFTISGFPYTYRSNAAESIHHPIFDLPTKRLLGTVPSYSAGNLDAEASRLLFLALLHTTTLVQWKHIAIPSEATIDKYLIPLASLVEYITCLKEPSKMFPSLAITYENHSLECMKELLQEWAKAKETIRYNTANSSLDKILATERRQNALDRVLTRQKGSLEQYAKRLATWTASAAEFPNTLINLESPIAKGTIIQDTLANYWVSLIGKCGAKDVNIWDIPKGDLLEIMEHLEQNLELGTVYSHAVFKLIQGTIDKQDTFFGINLDVEYSLVAVPNSLEPNSLEPTYTEEELAMVEPTPNSYPTKLLYLRAKSKWMLIQAHLNNQVATSMPSKPSYTLVDKVAAKDMEADREPAVLEQFSLEEISQEMELAPITIPSITDYL